MKRGTFEESLTFVSEYTQVSARPRTDPKLAQASLFTMTSTNGVLPISASQTSGNMSRPPVKLPASKLKVIVRRLPPGLTEGEFATVLGGEWDIGLGRVDWKVYKPGKNSKE